VKVEVEWLLALAAEPGIVELAPSPTPPRPACARWPSGFSVADAARVKAIERTTNHDVKAVEYFIKERLRTTPSWARRWSSCISPAPAKTSTTSAMR
jgi:adenylosuccinate lyase